MNQGCAPRRLVLAGLVMAWSLMECAASLGCANGAPYVAPARKTAWLHDACHTSAGCGPRQECVRWRDVTGRTRRTCELRCTALGGKVKPIRRGDEVDEVRCPERMRCAVLADGPPPVCFDEGESGDPWAAAR